MSQGLQDREDHKLDRAHHRQYTNQNLPAQGHSDLSRIKRLLKKSLTAKHFASDPDTCVHPELHIKTPSAVFPDFQLFDESVARENQPNRAKPSSTFFQATQSADPIRPRVTSDVGFIELAMDQMIETGNFAQAATEELSSGTYFDPSIRPGYPDTSPELGATFNQAGRGSVPRKPRSSFSKSVAKYYRPGSKASAPATPSTQFTNFHGSPRSNRLDNRAGSDLGPASPAAHSLKTNALSEIRQPQPWKMEMKQSATHGGVISSEDSRLPSLSLENEHGSFERSRGTQIEAMQNAAIAADQGWFVNIHREKYHPHPRSEVPYWMSYSLEMMNHHILMFYACSLMEGCSPFQLHSIPSDGSKAALKAQPSRSLSAHQIRRVLDIGCGPTATWCVGILREVENVEVVGLDICPLLLDLGSLEASVSQKFRFLQRDFLSCNLPFEAASFDYVHASFIAPGIPEQKWTFLLEEMARVLKPQGILELLEADQLIADSFNTNILPPLESAKHRAVKMWQFPNSGTPMIPPPSTTFLDAPKASAPAPGLETVKSMIGKLLDQYFVSPVPVSLLPSEISNISTGMIRPLYRRFIRFPSDPQRFSETQLKSQNLLAMADCDSEEFKALQITAENERMGMVLLHSHIDSVYSNKEIAWRDLWLPAIYRKETASSCIMQPSASVRSPTQSKPSKFVPNFPRSQMNRRIKPTNPSRKIKLGHNKRPGSKASTEKCQGLIPSPNPTQAGTSAASLKGTTISSRSDSNSNLEVSNSGAGVLLDHVMSDMYPQRDVNHEAEEQAHLSSVSSSEPRARRKTFNQIWDKWKEDVNLHSLGISQLLEIRFGWTCILDVENHKALQQHYETAQHELRECEYKISQLRRKLLDLKAKQSFELTESPFEDLNSDSEERSHSYDTNHHCHEKQIVISDGRSAINESSASFNAENSSINPCYYDGRCTDSKQTLFGHEGGRINQTDADVPQKQERAPQNAEIEAQFYEELKPNTTSREESDIAAEVTSDCSISHQRASSTNTYELSFVSKLDTENLTNDLSRVEIGTYYSLTDEELVPTKYFLASKEDQTDRPHKLHHRPHAELQAEIDKLIQKKAEIKKSLQLIQIDLDNVKKRLGITSSDEIPFSSAPTEPAPQVKETDPPEGNQSHFHDFFASLAIAEAQTMLMMNEKGGSKKKGMKKDHSNIDLLNSDHHSSLGKPCQESNIRRQADDLKPKDGGFGDLRLGKFYSYKGKGY